MFCFGTGAQHVNMWHCRTLLVNMYYDLKGMIYCCMLWFECIVWGYLRTRDVCYCSAAWMELKPRPSKRVQNVAISKLTKWLLIGRWPRIKKYSSPLIAGWVRGESKRKINKCYSCWLQGFVSICFGHHAFLFWKRFFFVCVCAYCIYFCLMYMGPAL